MTTGPQIWPIALPEVTVEDVFQAEGAVYNKLPSRPSTLELHHRQMLTEAAALVRPTMIWREVEVLGAVEGKLLLEGGKKLTSRLLARVAGNAEKLIMLAMTIGSALDERLDYYNRAGKTEESFILDAAGTAFILKNSMAAVQKLKEYGRSADLKTSFPMGPGIHTGLQWRICRQSFTFSGPNKLVCA